MPEDTAPNPPLCSTGDRDAAPFVAEPSVRLFAQTASAELAALKPDEGVAALLADAVAHGASDLFFFSQRQTVVAAVRRLGLIREVAAVPADLGRRWLSAVKAQAGMDIAERRRPLDGRFLVKLGEKRVDVRVNSIPTLFGEDLTLRLLDRETGKRDLSEVGLGKGELDRLASMIESPSGLILVTGPTGSGKTTTLYACLSRLARGQRKINTLEDPIEYEIAGVRQSQVNERLGLDFPELLRNVLRQAPDIIMIGEVRDVKTAITAVRAATSGHLVFATLHSPVAAGAVQSMLALGANRHFLASCLLGVVAQRLVRTLCPKCRVEIDMADSPHTFEEIEHLLPADKPRRIYAPGGCDACYRDGYIGRTGVFEVLSVTSDVRQTISRGSPREEIHRKAKEAGMIELTQSALFKVARGETSVEEILRSVPTELLGLTE